MSNRNLSAAVAIVFLLPLFSMGCSTDTPGTPSPFEAQADPSQIGPHPVGNICLHMTDASRYDRYYASHRQILVEVWYPAAATAREQEEGQVIDFIDDKWAGLVETVFGVVVSDEELQNFHRSTGSVPGAEPDVAGGPYPLVLFSHGNGSVRFQNYTLARHLASHGYIFVAVDHTENAALTALPDTLVIFGPHLMPKSFLDRPADLQLALDHILEQNTTGSGAILEGMVDTERIAVSGHSFGGTTVMILAQWDPRIKAGLSPGGALDRSCACGSPYPHDVHDRPGGQERGCSLQRLDRGGLPEITPAEIPAQAPRCGTLHVHRCLHPAAHPVRFWRRLRAGPALRRRFPVPVP